MTEREMEDVLSHYPDRILGECGLRVLSRQPSIGSYRFDLLLEDRHGGHVIVELQKGTLDRTHTYKILDYYHEYKEAHPDQFVDVMVVANEIPPERKRRLRDLGVEFKEVAESTFLELQPQPTHDHEASPCPEPSNESPPIANDSWDAELRRLKRLFIGNAEALQLALRKENLISRFSMYRNLPDNGQNWAVWWIPRGWGHSVRRAGIHWALLCPVREKRPTDTLRLAIGIEKPMISSFKRDFMLWTIQRAAGLGPQLQGFDLWTPDGTMKKLLAYGPFEMTEGSVDEALTAYRRATPFNQIVEEGISHFAKQGAFAEQLRYD